MLDIFAAILTFALELYATSLLVDFTQSTTQLVGYFLLHGAASFILAWTLMNVLPAAYRVPRRPVIALLFSFAFFIPLVGIMGMLTAVALKVLLPRISADRPFEQVTPPEFVLSIREPGAQLRISSLKAMLLDPTVPAELRLKSLNALQNMPTRVAAPTLRRLLRDPVDELRLIAYGMLDQKEKKVNGEIQSERRALQSAPDDTARLNVLRRLVELNWELIYSDLVQGDVRTYHLDEVQSYVEQALALAPNDPGLWFLKARGLQAAGRLDAAREAYSLAIASGLPEARALAYLAEIAFEQRDFGALRSYLELIAQAQAAPIMAPLIHFWTGAHSTRQAPRTETV